MKCEKVSSWILFKIVFNYFIKYFTFFWRFGLLIIIFFISNERILLNVNSSFIITENDDDWLREKLAVHPPRDRVTPPRDRCTPPYTAYTPPRDKLSGSRNRLSLYLYRLSERKNEKERFFLIVFYEEDAGIQCFFMI